MYTFTNTVSDARSDGFSLTTQISTGVTTDQEWLCQSGDLTTLTAASGPASSLSTTNGVTAQTRTTGNSGITLPVHVSAGDAWSQTLYMNGTVNMPGGKTGTAEGTYVADFSAVGPETVTVPAGTFEAMRINATTTYTLIVTVEDTTVPITATNAATLWYASGVGLVMCTNSNDFMGTETITLTGYNVP